MLENLRGPIYGAAVLLGIVAIWSTASMRSMEVQTERNWLAPVPLEKLGLDSATIQTIRAFRNEGQNGYSDSAQAYSPEYQTFLQTYCDISLDADSASQSTKLPVVWIQP